MIIIGTKRAQYYYSFLLDYKNTTNNRAKYVVLIIGLEILRELEATEVEIYEVSELVIN